MMMPRTFTITCMAISLLLIIGSNDVYAQDRLLSAVDYAEFKYDSTLTDVEIYTSISPARLIYHTVVNRSENNQSRLASVVALKYEFKNLATDSTFYTTDSIPISMIDTTSIREASRFVTITRLLFEPGSYLVTIFATNGDSTEAADSVQLKMHVRRFPGSRLSVSDPELCSDISDSTSEKDPYYKNTLHVVPNPKALYGLGMPVVSYYAEIYGLGRLNDTTEYALTWNVVDTYGRVVKTHSFVKTGSSPGVVEVGSNNVSDLPSGKYALELLVADSIARETASASRYFFVYNPYVKQPQIAADVNVDVLSSPFFTMGEKELDDVFHAANYLETPQETNVYQKLTTVDAKRRFIAQFWVGQNRKAGARGFNSWSQFYERFKYVNQTYKTAFKAGWLTDRGRVYVDYGPPDDIERHASSSSSKPYQIWTYNSIEGGVIFVFIDLTGFNDYVLIHSTKQGEVSDPDWQQYVQIQQH